MRSQIAFLQLVGLDRLHVGSTSIAIDCCKSHQGFDDSACLVSSVSSDYQLNDYHAVERPI